MDEDCKIADKLTQIQNKLVQIHGWAHRSLGKLSKDELHQAHRLGQALLDVLNDQCEYRDEVKFLAVFEVLSVGADVLENPEAFRANASTMIH
jgi:hypothetical protein